MRISDPTLLALLDQLEEMITSPQYAVRRATLSTAHQTLCNQNLKIQSISQAFNTVLRQSEKQISEKDGRIADLEEALRENLRNAFKCAENWDGCRYGDGFLGVDIGADIRETLKLGELNG